ncbi:MAG: NHL repeat-containing protein [Chloroflexota bacterium]
MKPFPFLMVIGAFLLSLTACRSDPGLLRPNSAVEAADGAVYVNDFGNHRVVKLDADGKVLLSFGRLGENPEQLYRSWDLTVGADGNLYLCNFVDDSVHLKNDQIKVFAPTGKFLREIGRADYNADGETDPNKPYGLDIDNAGNLYVADYARGTIRVFDSQGTLLASLFADAPEERRYIGLNDVAVDDTRGLLYTVDFDGSRLDQYRLASDEEGIPEVEFLQTVATYGYGNQQIAFPQYMAVDDASGRLYVGDTGNRRVQVFDADGTFRLSIPVPGVKEWQIMGVSLGKAGNLYVSDAYNNAIWVFTLEGSLLKRIEVAR